MIDDLEAISMIQRVLCPVCGKPADELSSGEPSAFPFCSDRCRKIDFFRWWDGRNAIVEDLNPDLVEPDESSPISEEGAEW